MGRGPGGTGHGEGWGTQCLLCFLLKTGLQESQVPETHGKFWSKEDMRQDHGTRWDVSISAEGANWCHCKATLDDVWKVMVIRKDSRGLEEGKCHILYSRRRIWGTSPVSLTAITGEMWQKPIPEAVSKRIREKMMMMMGSNQHWFMKEKLCSVSLIVISLGKASLVSEGRAKGYLPNCLFKPQTHTHATTTQHHSTKTHPSQENTTTLHQSCRILWLKAITILSDSIPLCLM